MRATVRAYGELNDHLPATWRQRAIAREWQGRTSVKDLVEGLGIPHPEIDLLLANGESVSFDYIVGDGDRIAVFPVFEALDIATVTRVRPEPLRVLRFVLDVHLGRLAAHLRLAGFDAAYARSADDAELVALAQSDGRVLLTRDRALLCRRDLTHAYCVRNTEPVEQLVEVVERFDLARSVSPFTRCTRCNEKLVAAERAHVANRVPARSLTAHRDFLECPGCARVYWLGSHAARLRAILARVVDLSGCHR